MKSPPPLETIMCGLALAACLATILAALAMCEMLFAGQVANDHPEQTQHEE